MPGALTTKQHELLTFIEQRYLLHGDIPTRDVCVEHDVCGAAFYTSCLGNDDFRHALIIRGINVRGLSGKDNGVLTEEQLLVANAMLDLRDNRSQKKKLNELGVSTQKWESWLRDPGFQSYLRGRAENLLGDNLHESHLALVDRVRSGDINAIKYFNEITGRYVPNASDKVDVNAVLMAVLEVLQRHVKDPDTLLAVSDDLRSLSPTPAAQSHMRLGSTKLKVIEGTVM
jgi:hypothetical protein